MHHDLDELDLKLLGVLQEAPRISWTAAGNILGISPAAASARWSRLVEAGLAWLSVYPNPMLLGLKVAFVTVECERGKLFEVTEVLCRDPRVVDLDECIGATELFITVMVRDLAHLGSFLLDDLSKTDGINSFSTRIVTGIHIDGSRWRLDTLDTNSRRLAARYGALSPQQPSSVPLETHWPVIEALTLDPRIPIVNLAQATGLTGSTASRRVAKLLGSRSLVIRLDMAPGVGGWGVTCSWMAQLPLGARLRATERLCRQPQVRLCMSTTGESNLIWSVATRNTEGIGAFEEIMGSLIPGLLIIESLVHTRTYKKMGWLTAANGRYTGEIVVPTVLRPVTADANPPLRPM